MVEVPRRSFEKTGNPPFRPENVRPQFLSLRQFLTSECSPRAGAGLKAPGTAQFGREPLDCDAGTLGSERSLSALFLSTSGLNRRQYGFVTHCFNESSGPLLSEAFRIPIAGLLSVSGATIDKMLVDVKAAAAGGLRRRVGFYSAIRREVPIRTFNDGAVHPGF
jgi:hypothetical protein